MHRPRRTRSFLTNRPCFPPTTSSPHRISKPPFTCISPRRTRNIRSTCSNILSMLSLWPYRTSRPPSSATIEAVQMPSSAQKLSPRPTLPVSSLLPEVQQPPPLQQAQPL